MSVSPGRGRERDSIEVLGDVALMVEEDTASKSSGSTRVHNVVTASDQLPSAVHNIL